MSDSSTRARVLALYLPQFHPIPENDAFWGKGFTEWSNVTRARPLYRGHYQPQLPTELGFYDLRVPEVREQQAELARAYGVEGFLYWHYWFGNGRMVLDRPLREVRESGRPDFPFCVAWANHSWAGRWAGRENELLVEQTYPGPEDYHRHFDYLQPLFDDPRYVRVDGKPFFMVYQAGAIPDVGAFVDIFRERAEKAGYPGIHLVAQNRGEAFDERLFDAMTGPEMRITHDFRRSLKVQIRRLANVALGRPRRLFRYDEQGFENPDPSKMTERHYPIVQPNWDYTARAMRAANPRWHAEILHDPTPAAFRRYLEEAIAMVAQRPQERRIVIVRSWNEWAEGNYLEPSDRYGRGFLEAIRAALSEKGA